MKFCNTTQHNFTATPNAEIILEAQKNPKLKEYLQKCELNLADSVSLLWAAMVQKYQWSTSRALTELLLLPIRKHTWNKALPEQVCGSDIFYDICADAEKRNKSIFLLGGQDGIAKQTKIVFQKKYPNLNIVGATPGSPQKKDDKEIIEQINSSKPNILFLAYGCPKQELWISRNVKKCPSVKATMGVGGTFDFVSGKIKRAPKGFRTMGLEWLWRLLLQPSRAKRIFRAIFVFPYVFLRNRN